eukprot:14045440-Alexandrium_andersonii.AAC.1
MSASLVGSEMCIRDSPGTTQESKNLCAPAGPSAGKPPNLKQSREVLPVSYTHLTLPTICSV